MATLVCGFAVALVITLGVAGVLSMQKDEVANARALEESEDNEGTETDVPYGPLPTKEPQATIHATWNETVASTEDGTTITQAATGSLRSEVTVQQRIEYQSGGNESLQLNTTEETGKQRDT
ncbi:uncharacterized protein LOC135388273 [Ornithodoros turicata]|uniref:uncharacterized protein LOC135388273 n=1 Tax=Ornithodoros turicata TaxID=34597 RepID=UPI0031388CAF